MSEGAVTESEPGAPAWGLRPAILGYVVGLAGSIVVGGIWIALTGDEGVGLAAASLVGLWIGLIGTPVWLSRTRGSGSLAQDFGLRFTGRDFPVGIAAGLGVQLVVVPLLYAGIDKLAPQFARDLSAPARELAHQASNGVAFAVLAVFVVIGAPVAEELFFRGLLQRSLSRRLPPALAIACSALAFALAHFQVVQFPALLALGLVLGTLFHRRGRLGPSIVAHSTFNAITMAVLWAAR